MQKIQLIPGMQFFLIENGLNTFCRVVGSLMEWRKILDENGSIKSIENVVVVKSLRNGKPDITVMLEHNVLECYQTPQVGTKGRWPGTDDPVELNAIMEDALEFKGLVICYQGEVICLTGDNNDALYNSAIDRLYDGNGLEPHHLKQMEPYQKRYWIIETVSTDADCRIGWY